MSELKVKVLINKEMKKISYDEEELTEYEKGCLEKLKEKEGLYGEL